MPAEDKIICNVRLKQCLYNFNPWILIRYWNCPIELQFGHNRGHLSNRGTFPDPD